MIQEQNPQGAELEGLQNIVQISCNPIHPHVDNLAISGKKRILAANPQRKRNASRLGIHFLLDD